MTTFKDKHNPSLENVNNWTSLLLGIIFAVCGRRPFVVSPPLSSLYRIAWRKEKTKHKRVFYMQCFIKFA